MTHIDDAVNFGRSMGLKVAAGLQSMAQLYDVYGKDKGLSIAAGFSSVMAFRSNDWLTTEYVRDAFGLNYLSETTLAGSLPSTERREGHVVEAWEVSKLKPGEAFIRNIENSPFKFKFKEYEREKRNSSQQRHIKRFFSCGITEFGNDKEIGDFRFT